jgi:uncharacterized protein YrrD
MRFSDAMGRQVVSTSTAATVGKVDEFVIDPARRAVIALLLKKTDHGDTLRWGDLTAFGADAVTVAGADRIVAADAEVTALSGKNHRVIGKRVLSTLGDELGIVSDIEFDPQSGAILAVMLHDSSLEGARVIGLGSYAVVVLPEAAPGVGA